MTAQGMSDAFIDVDTLTIAWTMAGQGGVRWMPDCQDISRAAMSATVEKNGDVSVLLPHHNY